MKLIDKAIEEYKGVWPKFNWSSTIKNKNAILLILKKHEEDSYEVGQLVLGGTSANPIYSQIVCIKEEFEKRARELGWINSHKYGVEYHTYGKKPDLPDDVVFEMRPNFSAMWSYPVTMSKVSDARWRDEIVQFRIVDERYKPKEPESKTVKCACIGCENEATHTWSGHPTCDSCGLPGGKPKEPESPENSWYDRGEFPPAGTTCEVMFNSCWYETYIVGMSGEWCVYTSGAFAYDGNNAPSNFRPIKSEREKFIQAVVNALHYSHAATDKERAERIYELGARLVAQRK